MVMTKAQERALKKRVRRYLLGHNFTPTTGVLSDYVMKLWMTFASKEIALAEKRVKKAYNLEGVA